MLAPVPLLALVGLWLMVATAVMVRASATGHGSHPDEANNGIDSSRFPNAYASPSHPGHPQHP